MDKIRIGQLIAKHRKAIGITQNELAEKLNISPKTISKWEIGKNRPSMGMLKNLSIILSVQLEDFMGIESPTFGSYEVSCNDAEFLFRKYNCYLKYIKILNFKNIDINLLIMCILNERSSNQLCVTEVINFMSFDIPLLIGKNIECSTIHLFHKHLFFE